ncbi:hypothetical protein AVEN_187652-1 [Araneus ventricosus]|uniref:Peptidase aspartic putative domain-containing protein n=1 Tax=Araneus ventricosus TaxID=182803 RepID=A0A4Y2R558_ARAVE|nr:hypothetical protein AVEN_44691-1 [Araneus ventricosus]GBN70556.1 hypothetical protein AVEN_187652-1 [Araneus ventricosus]
MIESAKSVSNVAALRKKYDELEIQVRSLESLGVAADTYSSLLCPIVLQKIPEEINLLYNRQRKAILNRNHDAADSANPIPRIHKSESKDSQIRFRGFITNRIRRICSFWSEWDLIVPFEESDPRIRSGVNDTSLQNSDHRISRVRGYPERKSPYSHVRELHGKREIYDVVQLPLQNRNHPTRKIQISAVVISSISEGKIEVPSERVRNISFERGTDTGDSEEVDVLIGSDFIWEVLRIRMLVSTDSNFGFVVQGSERESNCGEVHVNLLGVINEELNYDRVKDLSELEVICLNPKTELPHSDLEILEAFEQNATYGNNRYETK